MTLAGDEHAALRAGEIARLGKPHVGQQLRHPLAARRSPHAARQRLRADERRAAAASNRCSRRNEHGEVAEPTFARALDERERRRGVSRDHGRSTAEQRRRDRTLVPGFDLEQRQREALAVLRERTRGRRKPLELCE